MRRRGVKECTYITGSLIIIIVIDNFYIALFSDLHKLTALYKKTFYDIHKFTKTQASIHSINERKHRTRK